MRDYTPVPAVEPDEDDPGEYVEPDVEVEDGEEAFLAHALMTGFPLEVQRVAGPGGSESGPLVFVMPLGAGRKEIARRLFDDAGSDGERALSEVNRQPAAWAVLAPAPPDRLVERAAGAEGFGEAEGGAPEVVRGEGAYSAVVGRDEEGDDECPAETLSSEFGGTVYLLRLRAESSSCRERFRSGFFAYDLAAALPRATVCRLVNDPAGGASACWFSKAKGSRAISSRLPLKPATPSRRSSKARRPLRASPPRSESRPNCSSSKPRPGRLAKTLRAQSCLNSSKVTAARSLSNINGRATTLKGSPAHFSSEV